MKQTVKSQYEAHVAFELNLLTGEQSDKFIASQVRILWKVLRNTQVQSVVSADQIMGIIDRYVIEGPVTDELLDVISVVATQLVKSSVNSEANLGSLVNDEARQALVAHALTLTKVRDDLIHASIVNPLYSEIVSDVLYNGIAGYLEAGTEMTKKVPGMGSLVKKGGSMISKRVGSIEDRLRRYISSNLQGILNSSELMLKESLTDERITDVCNDIWHASENLNPQLDAYLEPDDIERFVQIAADLWRHFRATHYFKAILEEGVNTVLDDAKNQTLSDWIASIGIGEDTVIDELTRQVNILQPQLLDSGYLESAIRARLEPFYAQL